MSDFSRRVLCFDKSLQREMIGGWRGMGDRRVASPILYKGQCRVALQYKGRDSVGPRPAMAVCEESVVLVSGEP